MTPGAVLDRWFGRVSMYRLVLAALTLTLACAVVLALAGQLAFGVPAIVLTALAAVAGAVAGTLLGSLAVRGAGAHLTSAVITGLILSLVLQPVTGTALLGVAGAGAVAGLSKYVLAWRGRHLVNPAVVGLLVAGWLGRAHAWWWVGSAVLLPVVLLTGLIVLWRTRRLEYAGCYALVALVLTTIGYAQLGVAPSQAAWFALASSPIPFLAAFMLTEPLTSPPRRLQRLLVAVVVAVLGSAPLIVGATWLSPELALAVGNLLAFALAPGRRVVLRLDARASSAPEMLDLRFSPSSPLRFRPGQYVEVDVPQTLAQPHGARDPRGRRRVLSLASSPQAHELRLVTRLAEPGAEPSPVKRALAGLEPGQEVAVTYVAGDFLLPQGPSALIGLGIGITPFLAMVDDLARTGAPCDVVLLWAVRDAREVLELTTVEAPAIPGGGVLGALPARAVVPAGVRVVLVVPPGSAGSLGPGAEGFQVVESAVVDAPVLARAVPDLAERTVLVSGSPAGVAAVTRTARAQGARRVRTDVFLGY